MHIFLQSFAFQIENDGAFTQLHKPGENDMTVLKIEFLFSEVSDKSASL